MIAVLTEDSKAGFVFISEILSKMVGNIELKVYTSEGWSNLDTKFEELVRKGLIKDKLLVCFDRMVVNDQYERKQTEENIVLLFNKIDKIRKRCKELGIEVRFNEWVCFEEMFMCDRCLIELIRKEEKRFSEICKFVGSHKDLSDRAKYYRKVIKGEDTIEGLLSSEIRDYSLCSRNWVVNKEAHYAKLGKCYYYTNDRCKVNFNDDDCIDCKVKKLSFNKMWEIIYKKNYILADIIDNLKELNDK